MADIIELIREIMTLTSSVGGLKEDVGKISSKVESNTERIIRLENREELLVERMINKATTAVIQTTHQLIGGAAGQDQATPLPLSPPDPSKD